jgi:hypothetical protein
MFGPMRSNLFDRPSFGPTPVAPVDAGITTLPNANTTVANPVVQQDLMAPVIAPAVAPIAAPVTPFKPLKGEELISAWMSMPQQDTYDLSQFTNLTPKIDRAQEIATKILGKPLTEAELYQVGLGYNKSNLTDTIKRLGETQAATKIYQDLYGAGPTAEQALQATKDFNLKNINTKLDEALRTGATGDQLLNIAKRDLGAGADVTQYVTRFLEGNDDIINEYESLKRFGIDTALAGQGYFDQDKLNTAYTSFTDKSLQSVLGDVSIPDDLKSYVTNALTSGQMTSDQALDYIQNSSVNTTQEANRVRNGLVTVLGFSTQEANNIAKALQGDASAAAQVSPANLELAKGWFNSGLKDDRGVTQNILTYAASQPDAQNSKFFQDNPELFYTYVPLEAKETTYEVYNPLFGKNYTEEQLAIEAEKRGIPLDQAKNKFYTQTGINSGAAYGKYKGAPILDASIIDDYLGDKVSTTGVSRRKIEGAGSDFLRGASSSIRTGAGIVGLNRVETADPETGAVTYEISGNIKKAAEKAGLNLKDFKDTYKTVETIDPETGQPVQTQVIDKTASEQLFDAINDKYDGVYMITAINPDNPKNHSKDNYTATVYREVNGRLVPVQEPKTFKGYITLPEQKGLIGGTVGDMLSGVMSIPGIAEITMLAMNAAVPGSGTAAYPYLKGAQTAQLSGDIGEGLKSGAMAYAGTQVVPQISSNISGGISDLGGAFNNPIVNQALTGATLSGGIAGLTGNSVKDAAIAGGIGGGIAGTINTAYPEVNTAVKDMFNVTDDQAKVLTNTIARLAPTILTGGRIDPTRVLMNALLSNALKGNKNKPDSASGVQTLQT